MSCFSQDAEKLATLIVKEVFDGETFQLFLDLDNAQQTLGISETTYFILRLILQHWKNPLIKYSLESRPSVPLGVMFNKVTDLRNVSEEVARTVLEVNNRARTSGEGVFYGQLVVLGFTEYRIIDKKWVPYGFSNNKFVLQRRKVANGWTPNGPQEPNHDVHHPNRKIIFDLSGLERTISSAANSPLDSRQPTNAQMTVEFQYSPLYDSFQFGRAVHSTNDFIIPGYLHMGEDGVYTGPISRWAFRVLSERLPPYRSFLFAGGFNDCQEMHVTGSYYDLNDGVDGFTKFGIRMFPPTASNWVEISVLGNMYESNRHQSDIPISPTFADHGNQLVDGTLIDIGGIIMMFQDPITMARGLQSKSMEYIQKLKEIKAQCPVLFNDIQISYTHPLERLENVVTFAEEDEVYPLFHRLGPVHIPSTDYSSIQEDHRAYVYPCCGHVYAYHRSLEENPCPLCRRKGMFVPIATVHEPTLSDGPLTHVFNPCGHVASEACVNWWGQLSIFPRQLPAYGEVTAICPFCAIELHADRPFSKLIFPSNLNTLQEKVSMMETGTSHAIHSTVNWQDPVHQQMILTAQMTLFNHEIEQLGSADAIHYPTYAPQI